MTKTNKKAGAQPIGQTEKPYFRFTIHRKALGEYRPMRISVERRYLIFRTGNRGAAKEDRAEHGQKPVFEGIPKEK